MHHYKVFDHTADLGVEISGDTQADLFSHAALALFDLLVDAPDVAAGETRTIVIEGADRIDLFINFLREILYLFNGEGFVLVTCEIHDMNDRRLTAIIHGGCYNARKHRVKTEIKAVTYHQAAVWETTEGWRARVVFDV